MVLIAIYVVMALSMMGIFQMALAQMPYPASPAEYIWLSVGALIAGVLWPVGLPIALVVKLSITMRAKELKFDYKEEWADGPARKR